MPPRESATEYHYHKILADVIEEVLRRRSGRVRVPELALAAGFSRFHLTRLFQQTAEETLEQFLRRIRMERSAYMLLHSDYRIFRVALDSGYSSPEAFSRAFRRAFGCLPNEAKARLKTWELSAASDLHWNPDWVLDRSAATLEERVVQMPTRFVCVWRVVGDYSQLAESWQRLESAYPDHIPPQATFVTSYLDNLWTHPVCRTMKADIGWLCPRDSIAPRGMRKCTLPSGPYVASRFVDRAERTAAWSHMWGQYSPSREHRSEWVAYDEYATWPLPFEDVKTRILVGVK